MKFIPLLCALIALALPACSNMQKKKDCPTGGKCCAAKAKHKH